MATEHRLREELNRAAEEVHPDTQTALTRVVATARRRQRTRRVALAVAAAAVAVAGVVGVMHLDLANLGNSPPADHSRTPKGLSAPSDPHAAARTILTGEWQTRSLPASRVRQALLSAGIGAAQADRVLGGAQRWFVQITFSQDQANAALVVQTSDPDHPGSSLRTSDSYLYRLLPGHRLQIMPTHPGTRWVFSYRLDADTLTLTYLDATPSPPDADTTAHLVAWTFAPLRLVH